MYDMSVCFPSCIIFVKKITIVVNRISKHVGYRGAGIYMYTGTNLFVKYACIISRMSLNFTHIGYMCMYAGAIFIYNRQIRMYYYSNVIVKIMSRRCSC